MQNNKLISVSIIVAGVIIAGAIFFSNTDSRIVANSSTIDSTQQRNTNENNLSASARNAREVDSSDHIFGNENAKVTIIEYSDFECPFCARFHPTLHRIVDEFEGEVRWVYRHFPLSSIHSSANAAAVASECIAELGGNDAFWSFSDIVFANQRNLGQDFFTQIAVDLGISEPNFTECFLSDRYFSRIQRDLENVAKSGGRGTPYSIVINDRGDVFPFSGALPYEQVRQIIESII